MNRVLMRQACLNVGLVEPISIEADGTVWCGSADAPVFPDAAPINAEYDRLVALQQVADADARKRAAYAAESDPLFFMWQRGEATEKQWLDAVAAVKKRFES